MKKTIIILIVLILVGVLAYSFAGDREAPVSEATPDTNTEENAGGQSGDSEVRGTVVSVNTDQVPVDGPALVTIRTEGGSQAVVAIRSMGINLCPAQANIADAYQLKAGDKVEARGSVGVEGMILPCESAEHYLRVVRQ